MKKLILFFIVTFTLVYSCKKEDTPPNEKESVDTAAFARDTLYYIMKEWYLWYDKMPAVTKENYSDPYKLLEAMRYKELDRWSFVADYYEFMKEMEGEFVGHGFRIGVDNAGKARIAMIYNKAPLYAQGVRRGWIVKTINGIDIASVLISGNSTAYNNALGPSTAGVTNNFVFTKPDGTDVSISSAKAGFNVNTVLLYDTLHLKTGTTAGHIVFEQFILPSSDELATAFAYFKQNNVTDLILDLRYNGGGYLDIARDLASYIGGDALTGKTFTKFQYNTKHADDANINTPYPYKTIPNSLGLQRLVVITSRNTASASEAVMNGLSPFLTVVSVGDTTHGKPTGMNGWRIALKYITYPVTFKTVNSLGQGEYFSGIAPNKLASDDITHDFNDRQEACLKEAIRYLENGSFTTKSFGIFKNGPRISEKPDWMNNAFVKPQ
ncbi:MAG TPA: S41 family peptidase [Bacteroidales bacterium]|nr:S41 family peptidase [Bacteroidales bacterium]